MPASLTPEEQAARPAYHDGKQDRSYAVGQRIIPREAEDALLEAGLDDGERRRGLFHELAILEEEGPRLVRSHRYVARQCDRCAKQVLRQELHASDTHAVKA